MGLESLTSVVIPVYNEGPNIQTCVRRVHEALQEHPHEILVCYDFEGDNTLQALAEMQDRPTTVRTVRNDLGRGAAYAMRAGFQAARGDVVVTTMADLSDPPEVIPAMAARVRQGAAVVSGSRYMPGGRQEGGPLLKRTMSRLAGLTLRWLTGIRTHDCTNNFRGYSRQFLSATRIESLHGFELALELTVKAWVQGLAIDEVPTTWTDRTQGQSRFRLLKWLPLYLHWYLVAVKHALRRRLAHSEEGT